MTVILFNKCIVCGHETFEDEKYCEQCLDKIDEKEIKKLLETVEM